MLHEHPTFDETVGMAWDAPPTAVCVTFPPGARHLTVLATQKAEIAVWIQAFTTPVPGRLDLEVAMPPGKVVSDITPSNFLQVLNVTDLYMDSSRTEL